MAEDFLCGQVLDIAARACYTQFGFVAATSPGYDWALGDVVAIEGVPRKKREIACTRSFGQMITQLSSLEQAITDFTC